MLHALLTGPRRGSLRGAGAASDAPGTRAGHGRLVRRGCACVREVPAPVQPCGAHTRLALTGIHTREQPHSRRASFMTQVAIKPIAKNNNNDYCLGMRSRRCMALAAQPQWRWA